MKNENIDTTLMADACPIMTLIDPVNGGPIKAVHAEDYRRIVDVLKNLVAFDDLMNDPTWEDSGTHSGAYYAYYKGNSEAWKEARSFLPRNETSPSVDATEKAK
jgi:hypothetical protein